MRINFFFIFLFGSIPTAYLWTSDAFNFALQNFDSDLIWIVDFTQDNKGTSSNKLINVLEYDHLKEILQTLSFNKSFIYSRDAKLKTMTFTQPIIKASQVIVFCYEKYLNKSLEIFKNGLEDNIIWYGNAKILLILQVSDNSQQLTNQLLQFCSFLNNPNLIIYLSNKTFYACKIFTASCKPELTVFEGNSIPNNLFALHFNKSFSGCPIKAAVTALPPFIFPPNGHLNYSYGLEIELLRTLLRVLNFTCSFIETPAGESPFIVYRNKVPSGLLGLLHRRDADLAIGALRLTLERCQVAQHVDTYYGDDFVWVTYENFSLDQLKSFLTIFNWDLWCAIIATFSATVLTMGLLASLEGSGMLSGCSWSLFLLWAVSVNTSLTFSAKSFLFRFVYGLYLLYIINIIAAFQSEFYNVLCTRVPGDDGIDGPLEAAKAGLVATLYPSMKHDLNYSEPAYYNYIINNHLVEWTEVQLDSFRRSVNQRDSYSLVPKIIADFEINRRFTTVDGRPTRMLRILKNRYKPYEPVIFMSKDHPLLPVFKKQMRHLVESGLVLNYLHKLMRESLSNRTITGEVSQLDIQKFSNSYVHHQFHTVFYLLLALLLIAFFVFLCEVIWYHYGC